MLLARRKNNRKILRMTTDQCTPEQRQAIVRAAWERRNFARWVADKLLQTTDMNIRREAYKLLYELTEGK